MPRLEEWADFALIDTVDLCRGGQTKKYARFKCPFECRIPVVLPEANVKNNKSSRCKAHLIVCSGTSLDGKKAEDDRRVVNARKSAVECTVLKHGTKRVRVEEGPKIEDTTLINSSARETKRPRVDGCSSEHTPDSEKIVTIYKLIFLPTGNPIYTGQTIDADHRLKQHASRNSKCRLVRNGFRKHGRKAFSLEPILRCRKADADTNESYYIIQNNTLYPNGFNLRHGSRAGEEDDPASTALVPVCTGIVPFAGIADEARACAEAWQDIAEIVAGIEDDHSDAAEVCKDILRDVHPDVADGRTYTASDVATMINSVRDTLS